jgi:hypothetical protein
VFAPPLPGSSFLKLVEAIDPIAAPVERADATVVSRFSAA